MAGVGEAEPNAAYSYDLRGRLAKQTVKDGSGTVISWTEYSYNDDGIRVKAVHFDGTNTATTLYLIDSYNHTGYAQVLEETSQNSATPNAATRIQYTIGDDVISQTKSSGLWSTDHWQWSASATEYLLYDGHGSTRQVVTPASAIVDAFSYDAYGVMLGGNPTRSNPAATSLLYAGEHFDTDAQQYYLRARWYNPLTGRFNRTDPFAGNNHDPQSLHKYLYCCANPINGVDQSRMMPLTELVGATSIRAVPHMSVVAIPAGAIAGAGFANSCLPERFSILRT